MSKLAHILRFGACLAVAAVSIPNTAPAQSANGNGAKPAVSTEDSLTFTFDQVDIRIFTELVGNFTGKRFVVADDVSGKITVVSPPVSRSAVYRLFVTVLEASGYTVIHDGDLNRVVKLPERKGTMGEIVVDGDIGPDFGLVTRIIHLEHVTAGEIRKMLESHLQRKDSVSALDETNHIVITDTAGNIQRIEQLVRQLDQPGMARIIEIVPLEHADAAKLARQLSAAYAETQSRADRLLDRVPAAPGTSALPSMRAPTIVPAEDSNRLLLTGTQRQIDALKELIAKMDVAAPTGRSALNAIFLNYIKAEDAAKNITTLLEKSAARNNDPTRIRRIAVEASTSNNALLVDAAPEDFNAVRKLVETLDIVPEQVHISVLIAEVSEGDAATLGVEITSLSQPGSVGSSKFSGASRGESPASSDAGLLSSLTAGLFGQGLTFGIAHGSYKDADGNVVSDYPFILNLDMIKQNSKVKILSETSLGAQNNHEALVEIVEDIPVLESTIQGGSGSSRDVIQSISRMDVGVKLNIIPHIIPGGQVRVELEPIIEAVTSSGTAENSYTPTISKRRVKTTVTVTDGETIVIAGLTRNDESSIKKKIPLLGDIPLLGRLFRWDSTSEKKTNILIFVRPVIVRSPTDAADVRTKLETRTGISADKIRGEMEYKPVEEKGKKKKQ